MSHASLQQDEAKKKVPIRALLERASPADAVEADERDAPAG
jgi:hypothetical protein